MESLDSTLPVALYYQLKEMLTNKILSKEWKVGEKIPTEFELCEQYKVSRITVRQALRDLEKEGYLVRKQGRGTFVSVPKIEQNLMSFYSFSREFKKRGFEPHSEVLEFHLQIPKPEIVNNLKLSNEQNQVYYIKRLRYADNMLLAIETTYLPADLFPGLDEKTLNEKALYEIMRDNYGVVPTSAEESFGATLIGGKESVYFGMKKGNPAISLERWAYSEERHIEYTTSIVRGDKFTFFVKLN